MKICNNLMTKIAAFVLICGVVLLAGAPPVAAANVNIPDANLRKAIPANVAITEAGMKTLTSLEATGYNGILGLWAPIRDLTGLEKATNLTSLDLNANMISSISALSGLTNLTTLKLGSTINPPGVEEIVAISAASGHPFIGNAISNLTPLSGLTNLTTLDLSFNVVSDISALSRLTELTTLKLGNYFRPAVVNSMVLKARRTGEAAGHQNMATGRWTLRYPGYNGYNTISNISVLSGLTKLTQLSLEANLIADISPLVSNTGLGTGDTVDLRYNPLSYASLYTHIPALQARGVTVEFTNRVPTTLTKVSGDTQTGEPSTALANPFIVEVKDGATTPKTFAGVPVTFAVTAGGGTLNTTSTTTDATGRAQTTLTLGATDVTNTVTATVTHAGRTLTQTFTAAANVPPTFTSAATFSVVENTPATTTVGTVVATDTNSEDSVTGYTLSGVDSAKFAITTAGVLTFVASPDYDAPGDLVSTEPANAASNNEYVIVVTATSGTGARQATATQTLTITVTNVAELPGKPGTPIVTAASTTPTSLNVSWTAPTNTGPAITAYNLQYRKNNEVNWTAATYAGTATNTTLTGLTSGTTYDVQVLAKNSEGDSPWSNSGSTTTATNAVPAFTSASTFSVVENTTAVGTVVAADADSADSVTGYEITAGADSSKFAITNAGVLTFAAAPDYDNPGDALSATPANAAGNNQYIVVVTATSGTGARQTTATQTLTITVTDVPPPGKPAAPTVTVDSHTSISVTWTVPTNTGPAINDYDVQYRAGTTGTFTPWTHTGTAKTTTITGLAAGTSYQVQVRARSSEDEGPWSDASAATTTYQAEDVDADGDVDINDLVAVVENFGLVPPGRYNVDGDNDVDDDDIRAVFNAVLVAEAEAAPAPALAQTRITHTAKTLQHYVQTTKQAGVNANVYRGLAILEELIEPFLLPDETSLLRNYPNPFNPETWFPYQLSRAADVTFAIYSVNGTLVRTLSLGHQAAGVYRSKSRAAYWDGRNAFGEPVASGIYFYTLTAGTFTATGKMLIRK